MRLLSTLIVLAALATSGAARADCDVEAAVRAWADGWSAQDAKRLREDIAFEISVTDTDQAYRVELPKEGGGHMAAPRNADHATRFSADQRTYCAIADGSLNALTALAQATADDPTPLQVDIGEEYKAGSRLRSELVPAWFHFFTRGVPETVRFGFEHGREVHGGTAVPLYYGEGLRTAWYGLKPGMHVNRDTEDQANPFDSIFVVTGGEIRARFDGRDTLLRKGDSVFVPAGMTHEFWVDDGSGEFIVIMTGEGA